MAGIGEASAIIAVAQAGISLSMVIIAYVGHVRDAPKSISRIGNEIKSTSGRLEEIAEIIRDNLNTRLLLDTAVADATRCSFDCELILAQVGNLLVKGGWKRGSTELSKDDIDTSVVASLRWPFLKTRLDTPRVELQRIKADLILLFNVAMARKSSTPLINEYARKIPLLTKKKEEAARRVEEARHQARDHNNGTRTRSPRAPSRRGLQIAEEDPELSQQFWEFELERAKEQDDLRIQERAALLQAENNTRQRLEEDRQREIARKAIEDYKLQQEELKARIITREKQLSDELLALGLGSEQVASVLAIPSLKVDEIRSNAISQRRSTESQHTSLSEVARKSKPQRKRLSDFAIRFLSWRGNHSSRSYDSGSNSVESNSEGNGIFQNNRGIDYEDLIELWLVDVFSRQHTELAPSERWMSQKLERIGRSNDVWHRFAQLQPMCRVAIQDFLKARNKAQTPEHAWRLIHIGLPRRMMKMGFFGHNHQGQLVRLIISRRKAANQGVNGVFVVKGEQERTSQSTVRARTYLPRQLVSTSAIRECSYDYEERFDVPSENTASELNDVTDKTHIMIPEALTLKQVNTVAGLTKSYMESGREPWKAQPLFTYTSIENEVPDYDQELVYGHTDHRLGEAPRRLTPAHRHLENHQQGRTENRGPESPKDLEGADKRSFEPRRATPGEFDEIKPEEISKKGNSDVFVEQPIQRGKSVVFKDQQQPSNYTGYDENDFGRETDDRDIGYRPSENTEKLMKRAKNEGHEHSMQTKTVDLTRPTYIMVHRKHLSPATLDAYSLPWEWKKGDPHYIIIKQWIPEHDQIILFEHTRKLRERKMLLDSTEDLRRERDNLLLVEKKSPERSSRSLAPPTLSNAFDSLDKPWHKYENFSSRPPKTFPSSRVTTQSRAHAPKSVDSSDDDEEDHDSSGPAKGEIGDDADLIAKTLSRYTTFKIDQEVTAGAKPSPPPETDAPMSPTTSRSRSSTTPRHPSTLEDMKSSLEKMQIKQSRAEEEGDVVAESDLRFYAIPEKERRIKEKEDEAETRAEVAEDEVASASNASKEAKKTVPLSRVQWRSLLDVSPTKAQTDRSGERTSHLLKKMKRTDDLRNEDLADPSIHLAGSTNHAEDHAAQTTEKRENEKGNSSTERPDNERSRSTVYIVRRADRSPSDSESERGPLRRADTQLYEADSEGSGGEEGTFERRYTWRRPTVEEEVIETHVTRRPIGEDEVSVEEE